MVSFFGIPIKGASAEANNTEPPLDKGNEIPAEVIEVPQQKRRVYLSDTYLNATEAPTSITKAPEIPVQVVINNKKSLLNMTTTHAIPTPIDDISTVARVTEISGKQPFDLNIFLNSFTEKNPWYPELYQPARKGIILDSDTKINPPTFQPTQIGAAGVMASRQDLPENVVDKPSIVGHYLSKPVHDSFVEIPTSGGDVVQASSSIPPQIGVPLNNFPSSEGYYKKEYLSYLPPFPTLSNNQRPRPDIPGLKVIPLMDNPSSSIPNNRDSFPLYSRASVTSNTVVEYRPAFPQYRPEPVAYPSAVFPPSRDIIPGRYLNIIQCRPRFPIYPGDPWADAKRAGIPIMGQLIDIKSPTSPQQSPKYTTTPIIGHLITVEPTSSPNINVYSPGYVPATAAVPSPIAIGPILRPAQPDTVSNAIINSKSLTLVKGNVANITKEVWN